MKIFSPLLLTAVALSLTACGGGGSSSSETPNNTPPVTDNSGSVGSNTTDTANGNSQTVLSGRLVDSAVAGMQYETATQSGFTGTDGSFNYLANETVTFSLGDIVLPSTNGAAVITPLDVFSTTEIGDPRVMNLARLLQSLDVDGNPDNGINISEDAIASATGLNVNFASAAFDTQVVNLVANSGSVNSSLIDGETALDHFQETLFDEGIMERPQAPQQPTTPAPANNASSHPLVGTTAEFSNFSHAIAGTLNIIDDRTLQITNFSYDGGGPAVYFYLGTDGDYTRRGGGIQIGTLLNGRRYNSETITLTLPAGVTLDDFNGISVWCDLFSINFGDATF